MVVSLAHTVAQLQFVLKNIKQLSLLYKVIAKYYF